MVEEVKVSKFMAAITHDANKMREEISRETSELIKAELEKAEKAATLESAQLIAKKTAIIKQDIGRDFSRRELESIKKLFIRREEMTNAVIEKLTVKILAFTKTAAYKDFLLKSATEVADSLKGEVVTVLVKADDIVFKDDLIKLFPAGSDVLADAGITLGGVKAKTETLAADNTLDSKLQSQKEWFIENCGLKLSSN